MSKSPTTVVKCGVISEAGINTIPPPPAPPGEGAIKDPPPPPITIMSATKDLTGKPPPEPNPKI
jgi:hypothetical protein